MAMGYEQIKELISDTLANRPKGTEITPEAHQELEMQLLEYIRSIELTSKSPFVDIADANTDPVQPDDSGACYIAPIYAAQKITFTNFHGQDGQSITVQGAPTSTGVVLLIWNTSYWEDEYINISTSVGKQIDEGGEIFNDYENNTASGKNSHAEGVSTQATGIGSHTEGNNTKSEGDYSHSEGSGTTAVGLGAHAEGQNTKTGANQAHAEGYNTQAIGAASHAEGQGTIASGNMAHAEGLRTTALEHTSHSEGSDTVASGGRAHSEGQNTTASGNQSHAENAGTIASGTGSHSEGYYTAAEGEYSHTGGALAEAAGKYSFSHGFHTTSPNYAQVSIGVYNEIGESPKPNYYDATKSAFSIGNNPLAGGSRSDAFRVLGNGTVYADNTTIQPTADYAEMFEWLDGNPEREDRVGYIVALSGDKIVKATGKRGEMIVGIISGAPTVLGDAPMHWVNKYLNDEWGRPIYETAEFLVTKKQILEDEKGNAILDEDGNIQYQEVQVKEKAYVRKLNPDYNPDKDYVPREERPEWSAVGLLGKVLVRQDGTLKAGEYCRPNESGVATKSNGGFYVLEIISETQARVLVK